MDVCYWNTEFNMIFDHLMYKLGQSLGNMSSLGVVGSYHG